MALAIHSLEWSIAIMLPIIFLENFSNAFYIYILELIIVNAVIHYIIDDLKANQMKLNLIQDQLIHFVQIILTFIAIYLE